MAKKNEKTITIRGYNFAYRTEIPPGGGPEHTRYYWRATNKTIAALLPAQPPPCLSYVGMRFAIANALQMRHIPAKR